MTTLFFILLFPFRYLFLGIGFLIIIILCGLNWLLCGRIDHEEGLIGMAVLPVITALYWVNEKIINFHNNLKPFAWTYKSSVTGYRETLRWWVDRCAGDFEMETRAKQALAKKTSKKEIKFWTYVVKQAPIKRRKDAIEWNKKCDEYEKNPRPNCTYTRAEVEPLEVTPVIEKE